MQIYKITCLITGKVYVGQTQKDLTHRFKQHINKAHHSLTSNNWGICPKLFPAINKYGAANFIIDTLDSAINKQELNAKEEYWIRKLNTVLDGYNASYGGDSMLLSEESRQKLARSKIGNHARSGMTNSAENRAGISRRMTGSGNPAYGKPSPRRKRVLSLMNGQVYDSIHHAGKALGIPFQNISKVLNNKRNHAGGHKFEYLGPDADLNLIKLPPDEQGRG